VIRGRAVLGRLRAARPVAGGRRALRVGEAALRLFTLALIYFYVNSGSCAPPAPG